MYVLPVVELTALGFWNGDGQRDTLVASVYDAAGNLLGKVAAFKGTFAGFISDTAFARVVFDGNTGDGWNHLNGLQTAGQRVTGSVPEPVTAFLLLVGILIPRSSISRGARCKTWGVKCWNESRPPTCSPRFTSRPLRWPRDKESRPLSLVETLNVSVATGVCLFEALRQRR